MAMDRENLQSMQGSSGNKKETKGKEERMGWASNQEKILFVTLTHHHLMTENVLR